MNSFTGLIIVSCTVCIVCIYGMVIERIFGSDRAATWFSYGAMFFGITFMSGMIIQLCMGGK